MDEQRLKETAAKNIAAYRRAMNWTQAELAEKLNYSDKAVSKWERAENLPDVFTLKRLSELFGVTLDELCRDHGNRKIRRPRKFFQKKIIIPLLSAVIVWVIATNAFAFLMMGGIARPWLAFIAAVPVTCIVFVVFSAIWWRPLLTFIFVSGILWTIAGLLYLTIQIEYNYLFFIIAAPLQVLEVLWAILRKPPSQRKAAKESEKPKEEG
jgi:transcriptional regulator with XRE-family HTH domain